MQRLVSPELRVYTVSDREALGELVAELRLDKTLAGNLRQLLGFKPVGPGRQARQVAEDWQLLESVRWLRHLESGKLVPVVGSLTHKQHTLLAHLEKPCSLDQLKNLLHGRTLQMQGWQCVDAPADAWQLPHGASLMHLTVAEGAAASHPEAAEAEPFSFASSCRCGASACSDEFLYSTPSLQCEMAMPVAASSSFGAADLLSPPPRHADIQQQHSDSERDPAALAAAAARQLLVVDSKISEQQARHMVECNMLRALSCDLEQEEEAVRKRATEAAEAADARWQSQIDEVVQQSLNTNLTHVLNAKAAAKKEQSMRETAEGQLAEAELRLRQHKCAEEERRRTQLPYASAALSQAAIERGEALRSQLKSEGTSWFPASKL